MARTKASRRALLRGNAFTSFWTFKVVVAGGGEHHLAPQVFLQLGRGAAVLPTSDNDPFITAGRT
jgi:hypothetical protein